MRLQTCIRKQLRLKAHWVREVHEEDGQLIAEIERIPGRLLTCSHCARRTDRIHSRRPPRQWRDLRVREQTLVLRYTPCRIRCPACGPRVEHVPWANRWQRVTKALSLAIARLSKQLSWKATAEHFGVDWKTVCAAVKGAVVRGLAARPWKPLKVIGIDEVSRRKGHRYLTLVYDLLRGELVWVGENRDTETMERFFEWLGPARSRSIEVVCCDMWAIYVEAVKRHLPEAEIVFDRFHIVAHLNRAVDDVRRDSWRKLTGEEKGAFKRTRWLWLKNPWNLSAPEKRRLSALCRRNAPIVRAYYLKEGFQRLWDYKDRIWAGSYLEQWLRSARRSRLGPFKRFARMIAERIEGILTWCELRVSNGALEGMNNKVKAVSHRSYGFRTSEGYITAIWHGCANLPLE